MSKSNDNKANNFKKNKNRKTTKVVDETAKDNEKSSKNKDFTETKLDKNEDKKPFEELNQIKDQLLRSLAENENIRKRTSKDIEQVKKYGHISFVRDLLSSVDNLTRAVKAIPEKKDELDEPIKNLIVGVEIVLNEINSTLEKNFIKKIDPLGEKFDYNLHQAMYETPSEEHDNGIIIEVIQPGYLLHDRLVRAAMVGISKKNEKNDQ